jgi:2-dehydropantoate 2-reductase
MTFHILGLGSIGVLSAQLVRKAQPLLQISFLARPMTSPPTSYTIYSPDGQISRLSGLVNNSSGLTPIETLLVTTKAHHTKNAIQQHLKRISGATLLVFLQNGMGIVDSLGDILPSTRIVLGTTRLAAYRVDVDTINWVHNGETLLAPEPSTTLSSTEHTILSSLGNVVPFNELEERMYCKLALNACINPVTVIYNLPNACVADTTLPAHALSVRLATEVQRVYAVVRPNMDMSRLVEEVMRLGFETGGNISSMLADVREGRDTEIDFINGFIVKMGREAGVDVSVNEDIIKRVRNTSRR